MSQWIHELPAYILLGLTRGSMYALIALGYTLVYGVLQLINFAHSEVFMSGAFGSYLVVNGIVGDRHLTGAAVPLTVLAGLVSGAAVGAAMAWLLEKVAYRTLRRNGAPKLAIIANLLSPQPSLSIHYPIEEMDRVGPVLRWDPLHRRERGHHDEDRPIEDVGVQVGH